MKGSLYISNRKILFLWLMFALTIIIATKSVAAQNAGQTVEKPSWEKITPLVTKQAEVEKLFGNPIFRNGYISSYNSNFGKVAVWYAGVKNSEGQSCQWGVPFDTVLSYTASFSGGLPISKINYDLSEFKKEEYRPEQVEYSNLEKGVSFVANMTDEGEWLIISIDYFPTLATKKNKCSQLPKIFH